MNYTKLLGHVTLYAIGLMLIIEGIFLNIIAIKANDAQFLFQGAILIFFGGLSLSASRFISKA